MVKGIGNNNSVTKTAHEKLKKERNVVLRDLQTLKEKYSFSMEENENLEHSVANLQEEIVYKDKILKKYQNKCNKVKEEKDNMRESIRVLKREAETDKLKVDSLIRVR